MSDASHDIGTPFVGDRNHALTRRQTERRRSPADIHHQFPSSVRIVGAWRNTIAILLE
jgi:hypothetical protein